MRFTITTDSGVEVIVTKNVTEAARALSEAYPGEEIWVFACNRGRLCVLDGETIHNETTFSNVKDFDTLVDGFGERLVHALSKQWDALDTEVPDIEFLPSTFHNVANDDFAHLEARADWVEWTGLDPRDCERPASE